MAEAIVLHKTADVDAAHSLSYAYDGTLRLYKAPVVSGANSQVVLCKVHNKNAAEIITVGTFLMLTSEWNTLKVRTPSLALAAVSVAGN